VGSSYAELRRLPWRVRHDSSRRRDPKLGLVPRSHQSRKAAENNPSPAKWQCAKKSAGNYVQRMINSDHAVHLILLLTFDPRPRIYFPKAGETSTRKSTVCGIKGSFHVYRTTPANYILNPSPRSSRVLRPDLFSPAASAAPSLPNEKYATAYFSVCQ
jgi:hypothetical protein